MVKNIGNELNICMMTFRQFLEAKSTGKFGMGTGQSPTKLMAVGASKPAKPSHLKYAGLAVTSVYSVAKIK
jgi:hypothetical protein